ncbi:MAG: ATP-dependent helicase HrpB [Myxococcaceae bacterium]|nr:ATP-dependent helicase HrpB [Myxococcaceae bacterium]
MAQKAEAARGPNAAQATQKAEQVHQAQKVAEVSKAEKAALNKIRPDAVTAKSAAPVNAKSETSAMVAHMAKMMSDLEKGQGVMDKLINTGLSGKQISNAELLSLQAGMYKYTQELELTGKVVEKATSGLKDTLKTQV